MINHKDHEGVTKAHKVNKESLCELPAYRQGRCDFYFGVLRVNELNQLKLNKEA